MGCHATAPLPLFPILGLGVEFVSGYRSDRMRHRKSLAAALRGLRKFNWHFSSGSV
jgi:hypothetical protein